MNTIVLDRRRAALGLLTLAAIILLLAALPTQAFAQIGNKQIYHRLKKSIRLQECTYYGELIGSDFSAEIPADAVFSIVNMVEGVYVVKFWDWGVKLSESEIKKAVNSPDTTLLQPGTPEYNVSSFNYRPITDTVTEKQIGSVDYESLIRGYAVRYFRLTEMHFSMFTEPYVRWYEVTTGALVLPVKLRFEPTSFSKDVTFSGTAGVRFKPCRTDHFSISLLLGCGISAVTVDSSGTNGCDQCGSDRAALTAYGGVVIDFHRVQIGAFTGADWLSGNHSWPHQGKIWLGFGIGVSLFSPESEQKSEGYNRKQGTKKGK